MLGFLSNYMDMIILIIGLVVFILLIRNYISLYTKKSFIQDALNRKNKASFLNARTKEVEDRETSETVTPDTIRDYEKAFNEVVSKYNTLTQLIPLFPLFGILGTVAGLMMQIDAKDINELYKSLSVALSSTLWGLVATIILKLIATISSKLIEDTEIILDDYDKKFDNSVKLGNITSE